MARIQVKTAYALWRGSTDTNAKPWDLLTEQQREAFTGLIRAWERLKKRGDSEEESS